LDAALRRLFLFKQKFSSIYPSIFVNFNINFRINFRQFLYPKIERITHELKEYSFKFFLILFIFVYRKIDGN